MCNNMAGTENIMLNERTLYKRSRIFYNSIYMKGPEQTKCLGQKKKEYY